MSISDRALTASRDGVDPASEPPVAPGTDPSAAVTEPAADAEGEELSPEDRETKERLEKRDAEVRAHENAHASAGAGYAGSPSYAYQTGPDGKRYAVGGEVKIDTSEVPGDPEATIQKMEIVRRAALAPAEPSAQDRRVAAEASRKIADARAEASEGDEDDEERRTVAGDGASGSSTDAATPITSRTALELRGARVYARASRFG